MRKKSGRPTKATKNHAVLGRKSARNMRDDSSVSPKNDTALRQAKEYEEFAADHGKRVKAAEATAKGFDYEAVAALVAKGQELAGNEAVFAAFIELPFWKKVQKGRPKPTHRQEAVRFLLRRYRGSSNLAAKQASERWRAVKVLLADGVELQSIAAALKERGGYRGINRSKRKDTSAEKSQKANPTDGETGHTKPTSDSTICRLEADFGPNIEWVSRLRAPCVISLVGTIEELGVPLKIRVEALDRLDEA
ncbi:MAG: hypothetical protein EOQ52_07040 [Mesorhizobium sp.]|uniref:hypothetical protein n=1 Tax=Mesorhizobium sp. TaxID=1871066 RepID=UPI000FE7D785|nr:hypothetical protein [Mesorhizobium sp.]RWB91174.1 MAG: hypothetical protein EOQ52_07040 [Mesorhizobium sp.]